MPRRWKRALNQAPAPSESRALGGCHKPVKPAPPTEMGHNENCFCELALRTSGLRNLAW